MVTPKYLTGAFEGKRISCFGLKSGKHGNSSKYRGKNWKKKPEGIRAQKKKSQMSHRKQLATNTLLEYSWCNSLCPISKFYLSYKFTYYKNGNFLVLYVLRYFATQNIKATHLQAVFKVLYSSLISVQHGCLMQSLHEWMLWSSPDSTKHSYLPCKIPLPFAVGFILQEVIHIMG